jgi:hypothetical protein
MLSRRDLLSIIPVGAATCMGCAGLALCAQKPKDQPAPPAFSAEPNANAGMTWEQAFKFRYKGYIRQMKRLSSLIGNDKFPVLLSEATSESASEAPIKVKPEPGRDMENFIRYFLNELMPAPIYRAALTWDIVEKSTTALEFRFSQCLWASTFRAEDAGDIGYASVCFADYAYTKAISPSIKLIRTKTLMQGHDCCNHRFVVES